MRTKPSSIFIIDKVKHTMLHGSDFDLADFEDFKERRCLMCIKWICLRCEEEICYVPCEWGDNCIVLNIISELCETCRKLTARRG